MAQARGIELYTETHVDRFSHDPRRLLAVHDRLMEVTGGRTGLRVAADFSHYLHQIGNPHFPQWPAIAAGQLNLDPLDPDNLISRRIVASGLVGNGHLRAAVPNDLPRGRGSIRYPIVDPRTDAATAHLPNGGMDRPWKAARLGPWVALYRQIFAYQVAHSDRFVAPVFGGVPRRRSAGRLPRGAVPQTSIRIWLPSPSPMPLIRELGGG